VAPLGLRVRRLLTEAFSLRRGAEDFFTRLSRIVFVLRLIGGLGAFGLAWALPGLADVNRIRFSLLVLLFYIPYTLALYVWVPRLAGSTGIMLNALGDVLLIVVFYQSFPGIRVAVLLGGIVYGSLYAVTVGAGVGLAYMGVLIVSITAVELSTEAPRILDDLSLALAAFVLVALMVMLDFLTRERWAAARRLDLLGRALKAVTTSRDLGTTLDAVVSSARNSLDASLAAVLLVRNGRLESTTIAARDERVVVPFGRAVARRGEEAVASKDAGPVAIALAKRRPVVVDDIASDPRYARFRDEVLALGFRSAIILPLLSGEEPLGTLNVYFDEAAAVGRSDLDLLTGYAEQISLVIIRGLADEEEREAARRIREADRLKSSFLASVTHELRTPLTAALGLVHVIRSSWDRLADEQRLDVLERISANGERLAHLIDRLLDLSRLEAGGVSVEPEPCNLADEVDRLMHRLSPLLAEHMTQIDVPRDLTVLLDHSAFEHVLSNLLSNAVKFSPSGSVIRVGATRNSSAAVVSVSDEGRGVDPSDHERIFQRFIQANDKEEREGGAGIGLSLVRSYVELLGGRVWIESAPERGATFKFTLPLAG
jgi:signal transduction histidine kinase